MNAIKITILEDTIDFRGAGRKWIETTAKLLNKAFTTGVIEIRISFDTGRPDVITSVQGAARIVHDHGIFFEYDCWKFRNLLCFTIQ